MTFSHGGHLRRLAQRAGCRPEEILDFSASINPLGPPESLRSVVEQTLDQIVHYPDPECEELVDTLADIDGVSRDEIVVGNGSTDLLHALARALCRDRAVIPVPTYSDYADASRLAGMEVETIRLDEFAGFALDWGQLARHLRGDEVLFLARPNNPTGLAFDSDEFHRFASDRKETLFVVDEAFAAFVEGMGSLAERSSANVVVLRSLTKLYAIPGLRLGVAIAPAKLAARIRSQLPPWSVNTLAQAVGVAALRDTRYTKKTQRLVARSRAKLLEDLSDIAGLHVYPGRANYLLARLDRDNIDASQLAERLLQQRIAIRVCNSFEGLDRRFFRVAVREEVDNDRLVAATRIILADSPARKLACMNESTPLQERP